MKNSKIIIIVVLILAALITTYVIVTGNSNSDNLDYFVSKYSPNSLAYFNCKAEGLKEDSICGKCEQLFNEADLNRKEYNINNDADLVEFVRSKNKDCVNLTSGGN